ncbi:MAG TPA: bifunctional phosphopantothenoylcysteine decarboxylase/phosphopantothenate--cysteine ligase CoaBC [Oscillospiraceae bacterium]|nr:bifunctional phosphopantothenoylcysteine decarboxylase/phosphopantothenate--cysteine ligase CoaBC [Oscillospiraceae bacterium]HRW57648.1 bifunctional phosphopantothenoylcysteine decarboxylase/phosphopantothenate--cysteine ligase CoaBC [Oscillospiraceae bacterium]
MAGKKTILLGITGGIAAYKAAGLASVLTKRNYNVLPVLTKGACEFISPLTFTAVTGNKALTQLFDSGIEPEIAHIALAKQADLVLIAPASADVLAKLANGIADDLLTSAVLAATCKKLAAPAMNTHMFENPATQRNLAQLRADGFGIVEPGMGHLACGDDGKGRLADEEELIAAVECALHGNDSLAGKKVVVSAGPTIEPLDPVRYLTNRSTGKMGYAVAKMAALRGADVVLISGKTNLPVPYGTSVLNVETAAEMAKAVLKESAEADLVVMAAAVADYTPAEYAENKIKKSDGELTLSLRRTKDILAALGEKKPDWQVLCGFSMETENLMENSRKKLSAKHADLIVANSIAEEGAGFAADTNKAVLLSAEEETVLPMMTKEALADAILDRMTEMLDAKTTAGAVKG